jgi:hypothetical protein
MLTASYCRANFCRVLSSAWVPGQWFAEFRHLAKSDHLQFFFVFFFVFLWAALHENKYMYISLLTEIAIHEGGGKGPTHAETGNEI